MLSKDKFNQALSILEALGFKRLRDTPLADRLFYIFDKVFLLFFRIIVAWFTKMSLSRVSERSSVIVKMQLAVLLPHVDTFRAYDKDGDNMVSRKEFMQFIEESWKAAFRLLS